MEESWGLTSAELTNKFRWAIGTSLAASPLTLPYREQLRFAKLLAEEVVEECRRLEKNPGRYVPFSSRSSTNGVVRGGVGG